jgi:hypothetical protein
MSSSKNVAVKTNDIELNEHNKDGNVNNNDDDNGKVVKRGYFVSKFASYIGVEYEEDTETAPVMSYLGIILSLLSLSSPLSLLYYHYNYNHYRNL